MWYYAGCASLPPRLDFSAIVVLQGLLNGWPTASRVGHPRSHCRFGCGHESGDSISHYIGCPTVVSAFLALALRIIAWWSSRSPRDAFFLLGNYLFLYLMCENWRNLFGFCFRFWVRLFPLIRQGLLWNFDVRLH
jgi:hypothetical protein